MYEKNATNFSLLKMFYEIIDNAPTVEIATELQPNCNNLQQTQGEWKFIQGATTQGSLKCPFFL